jgi:hypothetical protein
MGQMGMGQTGMGQMATGQMATGQMGMGFSPLLKSDAQFSRSDSAHLRC